MISTFKSAVGKIEYMQDQIGNFSRDGNCKKDSNGQKSKTVTEIKNDGSSALKYLYLLE